MWVLDWNDKEWFKDRSVIRPGCAKHLSIRGDLDIENFACLDDPYKINDVAIKRLKKKYEESWGELWDIKAYHSRQLGNPFYRAAVDVCFDGRAWGIELIAKTVQCNPFQGEGGTHLAFNALFPLDASQKDQSERVLDYLLANSLFVDLAQVQTNISVGADVINQLRGNVSRVKDQRNRANLATLTSYKEIHVDRKDARTDCTIDQTRDFLRKNGVYVN